MPSKSETQKTVIVLGAKGRFGRAAVDAFLAAGWHVRAFGRSWPAAGSRENLERIEGDAFDAAAVANAATGWQVMVNALNPPYPQWTRDLPRFTANVIAAAKASGATVMIPGNVVVAVARINAPGVQAQRIRDAAPPLRVIPFIATGQGFECDQEPGYIGAHPAEVRQLIHGHTLRREAPVQPVAA